MKTLQTDLFFILQFVYESEKETTNNPHKVLLNQIQQGVRLKRVKCNDRSKPLLDGKLLSLPKAY